MKSILQKNKECYICGYPYVEEHHIYGGPNRPNSTKYGMLVYLCPVHHRDSSGSGVHFNPYIMQRIHEDGQRAFEKEYPELNFREIFGKNYL